jgi:YesN/AraC family two-component response regulator
MLPEHELSPVKTIHLDKNASGLSDDNADIGSYVVDNKVEKESLHGLENRQTVLIIDDNEEILWMLEEILSEEYNIITARDGSEGLEQLTKNLPNLVITDIMMDNVDGISMTKQIKTNPYTMHVPLIIISAKSAIDDKIEGIESGADAYISKPFSIEYLKTVARKLIEKHRKLREYYKSVASSFDYVNGQLLPKEDRDFIQAVIQSIEQNICDGEFSPEDLAEELCVSLRSLYRRFKDLDLLPPKEFIKKQRIEYSAKLLVSTKLTVQEIMYNAGFTTRSHFYKEFTKFYNMSPKEYREQENSVF